MKNPPLHKLYCPFPPKMGKFGKVLNNHAQKWFDEMDFLRKYPTSHRALHINLGELVARTHPTANLDNSKLVCDWCLWLFIRDDLYDKMLPEHIASHDQRFLDIFRGNNEPVEDEPLVAALCDLWQRTLPKTTKAWRTRFIQNMANFFKATYWEVMTRLTHDIPNVETYLMMRQLTTGMYMFIDLIEIDEEISLPPLVYTSPMTQMLISATNNIASWTNDIFSYAKEHKQGDFHNLVLIFAHNYQITHEDALRQVIALHNEQMRFFQRKAHLAAANPQADRVLKSYINRLQAYMRGNLDWCISSGRYYMIDANIRKKDLLSANDYMLSNCVDPGEEHYRN